MPNPKSSINRRGFLEKFMPAKESLKNIDLENNDQPNFQTNHTDRREFMVGVRNFLIGLGLGKIFWPTDVFAQTAIKKLRFLANSDEKAFEKAVAKFAKKTGLMEAQAKALFKFDIKRNPKNGLTTATITKRKPLRFLANSNEEALEKAIKKLAKKAGVSEGEIRELIKFDIDRNPKNNLTTATPLAKTPNEIEGDKQLDKKTIVREIRKAVLDRINYHRRQHGLQKVTRDPLAEKAAQLHAEDMLKDNVVSHWGSDGRLAYHRYSALGGTDAVAENASGFLIVEGGGKTTKQELMEAALMRQDNMYGEIPPNDGHRQTILTPQHNHVGIGIAFSENGSLFMAQEFISADYVDIKPYKKQNKTGKKITIKGTIQMEGAEFFVATLHVEPFPKKMTPENRAAKGGYGLPDRRFNILKILPDRERYVSGAVGKIKISGDGKQFSIPVELDMGPGIYTIAVHLKHPDFNRQFRVTNICIKATD